jgi:hypothetical protein
MLILTDDVDHAVELMVEARDNPGITP